MSKEPTRRMPDDVAWDHEAILRDIQIAENQIARGEGLEQAAAHAEVIRRLRLTKS